MKKTYKQYKIVSTLLIVLLSFVFVVNVAYAYFSSTKTVSGTGTMADFGVKLCYKNTGASSITMVTGSSITLAPLSDNITRDTPFTFKVSGQSVATTLGFAQSSSDGCSAYIRFWIDAYVSGDSSTNYGEYIVPQLVNSGDTYAVKSSGSTATYYLKDALSAGDGANQVFLSTLTLSSSAPIAMIGTSVTIKLSFEACQATNEAFKSVFNDTRGYYSNWS